MRRALLSLVEEGKTHLSLGTQLALNYLESKNLELESIDKNRYRLGKAIFQRFRSQDGGYVNADEGGYQVLLNYWGTEANFTQYSLTAVLQENIETANIRDRLIFIGSTAESIKDSFYTPYSHNWFGAPPEMSGVFIHANVASQIINAAMYDRPLLYTCSSASKNLWLLFWAINGAMVAWGINKPFRFYSSIGFVTILLILISYLAFLNGWWLPLVPALMVFYAAISACTFASLQQRASLKFQYTLDLLLKENRARPLIGKIAIEYLKQSENKANQILIERATNN